MVDEKNDVPGDGEGGTTTNSPTTTNPETPDRRFAAAPEGAEVYEVDSEYYLVYNIPDSDLRLAWEIIGGDDEIQRLFGLETNIEDEVDRRLTRSKFQKLGIPTAGRTEALEDHGRNPWYDFVDMVEAESKIRPWLKDEDFLKITAEAYLEGREPTEAEWTQTEWWQTSTERQREWMELSHRDPAQAREILEENRRMVRDMLEEAGFQDDPRLLAQHYADQLTQGDLTEIQLQDRIKHETDPYTRGASPFAGHYKPEDATVVQYGDQRYLRDGSGNYWVIGGPGQTARMGNPEETYDYDLPVSSSGTLLDFFEQRGEPDASSLGGEERVRELMNQWLGPYASDYDHEFIGTWAHRIRQNPDAEESLVSTLRQQRKALFPMYDESLTWNDIAQPWKSVYQQFRGTPPQESDSILHKLVKNNDLEYAEQTLRQKGIQEGWSPVVDEMLGGLSQATSSPTAGGVVPSMRLGARA